MTLTVVEEPVASGTCAGGAHDFICVTAGIAWVWAVLAVLFVSTWLAALLVLAMLVLANAEGAAGECCVTAVMVLPLAVIWFVLVAGAEAAHFLTTSVLVAALVLFEADDTRSSSSRETCITSVVVLLLTWLLQALLVAGAEATHVVATGVLATLVFFEAESSGSGSAS